MTLHDPSIGPVLTSFATERDDDSLKSLTGFDYVRTTGSPFVLAKLCLSAVQPHGRIGSVLDRTTLKVEHYMDRIISRVRGVLDKHRTRSPMLVLALLSMLQQWCIDPLGMSRNLKIEMEEMASSAKAETMDTDEEYERLAVIKLEVCSISKANISRPTATDSSCRALVSKR